MDACPQLLPLRRLFEGGATEGMAGAPTAAAAAGAAHRGSTSGPGSYVAPAPGGGGGGQGAGAAPRNGGGGPTLGTAALANFGGASACARGATGLGNAGVPNDACSGMAIMRANAAGRGSDARDVKPVGGAPKGPGMGQRGPSQAASGAGIVKQESGSGPRAGAPQPEAEDWDDDEELDDELKDGSEHGSGEGSEEDSWEEHQRRRGPVWYLSGDEMEGEGPEDEAWYRAQRAEWEDEEEEEEEEEAEEEEEESDLGSEAGEAAVAELRAHLDQPLYPGARAGLTLRTSCQDFLRLCERHSFSTAAADGFLRLEAEMLPTGHHAPTSMRLLRKALGALLPASASRSASIIITRSPEAMRARLASYGLMRSTPSVGRPGDHELSSGGSVCMGRALSNWRALPRDRSCADAERCSKGLAAGVCASLMS